MSADNSEGNGSNERASNIAADRESHSVRAEIGVAVPPDTWARIYAQTRLGMERGKDPEYAWHDAVNEYIDAIAVPVVGGEERGLRDVLADVGVDNPHAARQNEDGTDIGGVATQRKPQQRYGEPGPITAITDARRRLGNVSYDNVDEKHEGLLRQALEALDAIVSDAVDNGQLKPTSDAEK